MPVQSDKTTLSPCGRETEKCFVQKHFSERGEQAVIFTKNFAIYILKDKTTE